MFIPIAYETPPDIGLPMPQKGEDYCRTMTRSQVSSMDLTVFSEMHKNARDLENAYAGDLETKEDFDTFLTDETLNSRNRVMWDTNLITPILRQYVGDALQTEYNASVKTITHRAVTRKLQAKAEMMLMHSASEFSADMKAMISKAAPIGDTLSQTMGNFESAWDDPFQKAINNMVQKAAEIAGVNKNNGQDAWDMAFWGMVVNIFRDKGSFMHLQRIHPGDFFFDTSAKYLDLSDASFMGCFPKMNVATIFQMWDIPKWKQEAITKTIQTIQSSTFGNTGGAEVSWSTNKIRVISNFWTDVDVKEIGYISGPGGVPTQVCLSEDKDEDGENYTYDDLIDPPEGVKEVFKGKKSRKTEVEVLMYCDMIPHEYLLGGAPKPDGTAVGDIVLDYGVAPNQPYNPFDPLKVTTPFQVNIFSRAQGKIIPPLLAILKPNRFVARILGAMESQLNMSGGEAIGVDTDMLSNSNPTGTHVGVAIKQGKIIEFNNGGRGISNAMHRFDNTAGQGTHAMLQIVMAVQEMVRTLTGVHGPMMGEDKKGQLVGVTDILVRRGMAMQEPFHYPLADNKEQQYRYLATAGKEYLLSRPDLLMDLVTDADMAALLASEDMSLERCNAKVIRENPENTRKEQANNWLNILIQFGFIDQSRYAELYNNSYPEDVSVAIKQYAAELQQAKNAAAKEQAKQQAMQAIAMEGDKLDQERQQIDDQKSKTADMLAKENAKATGNIAKENVKAGHKQTEMVLGHDLQQEAQPQASFGSAE